MSIGPQGPLLKNDGPACRCCGCTEHNACVTPCIVIDGRGRRRADLVSCSWVKVEGATEPLCSACSGTPADLAEAIERGCRMLQQHTTAGIDMAVKIGKAARRRYLDRLKAVS